MAHKGHPVCDFPSKAKCEQARKEALGKCQALTADQRNPTECTRWAQSLVGERGFCDQHAGQVLRDEIVAASKAFKVATLNAAIDRFLAWTARNPSVHDRMPKDWGSR